MNLIETSGACRKGRGTVILRKAAGPAFIAALVALACEGRARPIIGVVSDSSLIGGGNPPPALATVLIVDNEFQPSLAVVRIGGIVAWVWGPGVTEQHNVTFADSSRSSPTQTQGTHSVTFSTAGTFVYSCTIHPAMTGSVVVR